jgi:hypothetical protein
MQPHESKPSALPLHSRHKPSICQPELSASAATMQVADIKVYLMMGDEVLCKTQVPVWDVPVRTPDDERKPPSDAQQREDGGEPRLGKLGELR